MVYFEHQGGLGQRDAGAGGIRRLMASYLLLANRAGMHMDFQILVLECFKPSRLPLP